MKKLNFRTNKPQDFGDIGGKHQAVYLGHCVVCGTRVYGQKDYEGDTLGATFDPDCRGMIGDHSAAHLIASEYDKTGDDVLMCAICENTQERYQRALAIAYRIWK